MISKEEIKKLADLARIEIKDDEAETFGGEISAILNYVKSVDEFQSSGMDVSFSEQVEGKGGVNIFRPDEDPNESGTYSNELIAEFPRQEKNYLKVKKIL